VNFKLLPGNNDGVRELRPIPPPTDLRAVDRQRSNPNDAARWPSDRPAQRPRAEAAEPRTPEPGRSGDAKPADQPERVDTSDSLAHFEPRRAGLPDVPAGDAARYVEARHGDRPWLNAARSAPEDVQHVFAALDQGGGHAHIRHEGWVSPEKSQLRVQRLEDPAQLDPAKKANGIDGLLPGNKKHYCAAMSTAIRNPTAFAEAFAKGTEHPDVRRVLVQMDTDTARATDWPARMTMLLGKIAGPG
jgi:hypothetical protein